MAETDLKSDAEPEMTGEPEVAGPPPTGARVAVGTLFLVNGALFGTWVSRIPAVQEARGLGHAQLGLALLAIALGALFAMPLAGKFLPRAGSHHLCRWFGVLFVMFLPLLAVVPGHALFIAMLFCFGAFHGAVDVAMNAQAVEVEKRYPRPIMSSLHAMFSGGGLAGAALGGVAAGAGIPVFTHFMIATVVMGVAGSVLVGNRLLDDRGHLPEAPAGRAAKRFRLPHGALLGLGVLAFCTMVGEGAMADWTGVYLRRVIGSGEGVAAAGYAAFSIMMAATRFAGDRLSARFGPQALTRASGVLATLGMALALTGSSAGVVLAGFAFVGAGFATVVPAVFSAAGRVPGISPGAALATVSTVGYTGFLIGPPLIGFAAEWLGLRGALCIVAGTSAMIILLAGFTRPRQQQAASTGRMRPGETVVADGEMPLA